MSELRCPKCAGPLIWEDDWIETPDGGRLGAGDWWCENCRKMFPVHSWYPKNGTLAPIPMSRKENDEP